MSSREVMLLSPVPPFRLDLTAWALRRRKENAVDNWLEGVYRRVLVFSGKPVLVQIRQIAKGKRPELEVQLKGSPAVAPSIVARKIEDILGLRINLTDFYVLASDSKKIGPLVQRFSGVKPPRFPSLFEALVNGICCQQLSLSVGIVLLSRLAYHFGLGLPGEQLKSFPEPESLASLNVAELQKLGFSHQKAQALIDLSQAFSTAPVEYADLERLENEAVISRLQQYRGIGRWTAEYALLRGLRRLDMFPGDDVGARNNMKLFLGIDEPLDYQSVKQIMARWHPFEGMIYFHFLLERLRERGYVTEEINDSAQTG